MTEKINRCFDSHVVDWWSYLMRYCGSQYGPLRMPSKQGKYSCRCEEESHDDSSDCEEDRYVEWRSWAVHRRGICMYTVVGKRGWRNVYIRPAAWLVKLQFSVSGGMLVSFDESLINLATTLRASTNSESWRIIFKALHNQYSWSIITPDLSVLSVLGLIVFATPRGWQWWQGWEPTLSL